MGSEKSKPVLIGIAVVCLAGAGILMWINWGGADAGARAGEPIPMICLACGNTYEVSVNDFQSLLRQQGTAMAADPMAAPRYDCPACDKKAAQTGIKCSGCSTVFVADYMRNPNMKCPKCGKSNP